MSLHSVNFYKIWCKDVILPIIPYMHATFQTTQLTILVDLNWHHKQLLQFRQHLGWLHQAIYWTNVGRFAINGIHVNFTILSTLSSSRVNPRPERTRVLYLKVMQRTTGRRLPPAGRGAILRAFWIRVLRRRILRAGWLNHVLTQRCQSLWKWPLGTIWFLLGAILRLKSKK